jgi:ribA/ribD-fused uncharacterized protein
MEIIDKFSGEYRWLSNFYPSPVFYLGAEYPTVEHAYQASKCNSSNALAIEQIHMAATPGIAKKLGRKVELRDDWDRLKQVWMLNFLRQKFSGSLKEKLIATGDALLIEGNNWKDYYWGVCDGIGENRLGEMIMNIRSEFIWVINSRPWANSINENLEN